MSEGNKQSREKGKMGAQTPKKHEETPSAVHKFHPIFGDILLTLPPSDIIYVHPFKKIEFGT